jgi:hypothetical protein
MRSRRGTILLIIAGLTICLLVVVAGTAVWFFASAYEAVPSDHAAASREFEMVRQRLGSEPPVIDIRDRIAVLNRKAPEGAAPRELQRLLILAWGPDEQRLSRITLPWWLIRVREGTFDVSLGPESSITRVEISPEDIEQYGPALLIDHAEPDGSRVLVWTE